MDLQHIQSEVGSSGRFGEVFIALGIVILLGGIAMWGLGAAGAFDGGIAQEAGSNDSILVGLLFVVEGLGFTIFGAVALLSGWDRHKDHED